MYSVIDDAVKIAITAVLVLLIWWFCVDPDGTVGGVEID